MKKLLVLSIALTFAASVFAQEATVTAEKDGFKLSIVIQGKNAKVAVQAPATGWVAVGLDPTRMMKGADFLIGYVKDGVTVVRDDYGVGQTMHASDSSQGGIDNIIASSGEEKAGTTRIVFTVPVDSGDSKDGRWTPGPHAIIMACSGGDSFSAFHKALTKFQITIPEAKK